ncbi:RidA family protein [candidate division KSB1 bacterium]|nr:RidA family protein [candidate division KSB1 bacterium]
MFKKLAFIFIVILFIGCDSDEADQVTKEIIKSPDAPAAIGPYSQAIKVGNTLYCSGQIAIDPKTGELVTENIEAETKQVLDNLGAVLKAAGMDYSDVVQATVYMTDMENYKIINGIYGQYFKENPPARVAVQVANLPRYVNVEIACIAVKAE